MACLRNDNSTDWVYGTTVDPQSGKRVYTDNGSTVRRLVLDQATRGKLRADLAEYYSSEQMRVRCNRLLADILVGELRKHFRQAHLVHNVKIGEEFLSLASLLFAKEMKIPFVMTPISHSTGWTGEIFSELYSEADALLAMTPVERDFLVAHGAKRDNVHVVGVGPLLQGTVACDNRRFRSEATGAIVLFLGQKYAYKGIGQLAAAAPLVWEKHPSTRFVFLGPRTHYSTQVFEHVCDSRVLELGTVSMSEKEWWLSACDILCVPSVLESLGGVYLEAWSFRKPVVAAETAVSQFLIDELKDGLLVQQEPSSIATALCVLIENSELRREMGEKGYQKVQRRYNWERVARRVERVYRSTHALVNSVK